MKNIPCDFSDVRLPRHIQLRRMKKVIATELTESQRTILLAVYFAGKKQAVVAAELGLSPSTVCRTLHRAERRLQRFLRY